MLSGRNRGVISTFSWGTKIFFIFQCHRTVEKLEKTAVYSSNLTLFIVPFFLSFFFFFYLFSFLFLFFLFPGGGGRRFPQPPSNDAPRQEENDWVRKCTRMNATGVVGRGAPRKTWRSCVYEYEGGNGTGPLCLEKNYWGSDPRGVPDIPCVFGKTDIKRIMNTITEAWNQPTITWVP